MRIASVAEVKAKFSGYLQRSKEGPVVVTKNGKPVAVILAVEDEDELERLLLAHSPRLKRLLEMAEREIEGGYGVPHDEFWDEVEKDDS